MTSRATATQIIGLTGGEACLRPLVWLWLVRVFARLRSALATCCDRNASRRWAADVFCPPEVGDCVFWVDVPCFVADCCPAAFCVVVGVALCAGDDFRFDFAIV